MVQAKATRQQIKQHNRRLILRTVYEGVAESRAALAQITGLAKPTVSEIVNELIEEGFLQYVGRGQSTDIGGKRPNLLRFVKQSRQVIGVSVGTDRVFGILTNLDGMILAQHQIDLEGKRGDDIVLIVEAVIHGLMAQLDAPLLCIGVGVPGIVDSITGVVRAAALLGWHTLPLAAHLIEQYQVPVHVANNTELAAIAQLTFTAQDVARNLVIILIHHGVEIGVVFGNSAYHYSNDVSSLRVIDESPVSTPAGDQGRLISLLGWSYVQQRIAALKRQHPHSTLPATDLTYLDIRYHALRGDEAANIICSELAHHLAQLFGWVISLLRPDHIVIAGAIKDLGVHWLDETINETKQLVYADLVQEVEFSLTEFTQVSALGVVAQSIQKELGIW